MANTKVSQLPSATAALDNDLLMLVQNGTSVSLPVGLLNQSILQPYPAVHLGMSHWKRHASGSGNYGQTTTPAAVAITNVMGLDLVGAVIHVQGSLNTTTPPVIELGVYSAGADGAPDQLLAMKATQPASGGQMQVAFDTPILAASHGNTVYLAYALYSTLQLTSSENSGQFTNDFPYPSNNILNSTTSNGDHLVSVNTITGTGLTRVWPTSWGAAGVNVGNVFPNVGLRFRKPAP